MEDLNFAQMQQMQSELQEKYKALWGGLSPANARDHLLWMLIEAGEAADVIKKRGDDEILRNPQVRHHFIEELCDTLMYFSDVMLCYGITPKELSEVYAQKHDTNMKRW